MSWYAIAWSEQAPVANAYERAVITLMAHRAKKDGTGAYPSIRTMARYAVASERTIERAVRSLLDRGVIAEGDQNIAAHIDVRYRPKVYDLMIPASWYSPTQLAEVNQERAERGLPPLTDDDRPPLPPATPSRKTRSDVGVPKPKRNRGGEDEAADTADDLPEQPPDGEGRLVDTPEDEPGATSSRGQGRLVVGARGDYKSPNTNKDLKQSEKNRGGAPTGVRHQAPTGSNAPPPPLAAHAPKADWREPGTWYCSPHLAKVQDDSGFDVPPCGNCARVKEWAKPQYQRWQNELAAQRTAEAETEAERARSCRWHDPAEWVLDPDTGLPLEPAVKCDHRTPPAEVKARVLTRAREHTPAASEAARARARAAVAKACQKRRRPPVEDNPGGGGLDEATAPVGEQKVAV